MHDDEMEPILGISPEDFPDMAKLAGILMRRLAAEGKLPAPMPPIVMSGGGLDLPAVSAMLVAPLEAIALAATSLHRAARLMIGAALLCGAMAAWVLVILLTRSF